MGVEAAFCSFSSPENGFVSSFFSFPGCGVAKYMCIHVCCDSKVQERGSAG